MLNNQFLKVKNSLLELEKDFRELKYIVLKDRDVKTKKEIEQLFLKSMSIADMDRFEKKEMKNIRPVKNDWYDQLINYVPEFIRKSVGGFKDKIVNLFKTNTPKKTVYGRGKKLSKPKKQIITKPFISEVNKEKIKDRIFKDIRTLFGNRRKKRRKKLITETRKRKQKNVMND